MFEGLNDKDRSKVQEAWTQGDFPVISATVSFGMGVDKASVRYCVKFLFELYFIHSHTFIHTPH